MKKRGLLASSMLIAGFLTACTASTAIEPSENSMILSFENTADFDFYGIEVITQGHIQGTINADGSDIQKGDILTIEFMEPEDFDLEGEKVFEFTLVDANKNSIPLEELTLELEANHIYSFEISGNTLDEAELKQAE